MIDADYFNTRYQYDARRDVLWRMLAQYLQRYVDLNDAVLDLGAGYCGFINNIKAKERVAVDIYEGFAVYANEGVATYVRSCTDLSCFQSDHFDVVFASNLFEHLEWSELEATLSEVRRVMKSQATLLVIQPNFRYSYREYFDDYTHRLVFTHVSISDLLQARGFEVREVVKRFLPMSLKSRLPVTSALVWVYLHLPIKPFAKQMLVVARKKQVSA